MSRSGAYLVAPRIVTPAETLETVEDAIEQLDEIRRDLANVYARLPSPSSGDGHPDAEFEIGELLQKVRQGYVRARKARGVLAQQTLPHGGRGGDESEDDDDDNPRSLR